MSVRTDSPISVFKAYRAGAAVLSFIGWIGLAIAFFTNQRMFFASYMYGFAFWMCLSHAGELNLWRMTWLESSMSETGTDGGS